MQPPFRLESVEEVDAQALELCSVEDAARLREVAREVTVCKPEIWHRLPEKTTFEVYSVRERYRRLFHEIPELLEHGYPYRLVDRCLERYGELWPTAPASRQEAIDVCLATVGGEPDREGAAAQPEEDAGESGAPETGAPETGADAAFPVSTALRRRSELFSAMSRLVRRYLHHRDARLGRVLSQCLHLLLLYDPGSGTVDAELGRMIEGGSDAGSEGALRTLYRVNHDRLHTLRRVFFSEGRAEFAQRAKKQLMKVNAPPHVTSHLLRLIGQLGASGDAEEPASKIYRALDAYGELLPASLITRLRSTLENFVEKNRALGRFFEEYFAYDTLAQLDTLFERAGVGPEGIRDDLVRGLRLELYPCKDYHDYLKGRYSQDCSIDHEMAVRHLSARRFFNIRIFQEGQWVGNVYCLDYVGSHGMLVVDRIQIAESFRVFPLRFFPQFVDALLTLLGGSVDCCVPQIVAPQRVSNFQPLQQSFDRFAEDRPRTELTLDEEDAVFESYYAERFVVLSDC